MAKIILTINLKLVLQNSMLENSSIYFNYALSRIVMLFVLSPSKDLDYKSPSPVQSSATPKFWNKSLELLKILQTKKSSALIKLMNISKNLAEQNVKRYQEMHIQCNEANSKPALFAFSGDVYRGIDACTLQAKEIQYLEQHCRILSGFYGYLHPLDLIQPYRLEMGIALKIGKLKNLYLFWKELVTDQMNLDIESTNSKFLINLASQEYFDVIDQSALIAPVINIHFRENRNGKLSFISYSAKKARGLMARHMALSSASTLKDVYAFESENYKFDPAISNSHDLYFVR